MNRSSWDAIGTAACLVALGAGLVWWRGRLLEDRAKPPKESWAHVRERFPIPEPVPTASELSPTLLEALVRANPFSPERRKVEPVAATAAAAAPTPAARFVFKGRVVLGAKQRAIVEEQTSKKTYFLQVGQEVAGFKVLDIVENRVLLSDTQSNEEVTLSLTQPESERVGSHER
jgi:hypothetical protein